MSNEFNKYTEYYPNGNKKWEAMYSEQGVLHGKGKAPALIEYTSDGKKDTAYWYINGELTEEWWYFEDGTIHKGKKPEVFQEKKIFPDKRKK